MVLPWRQRSSSCKGPRWPCSVPHAAQRAFWLPPAQCSLCVTCRCLPLAACRCGVCGVGRVGQHSRWVSHGACGADATHGFQPAAAPHTHPASAATASLATAQAFAAAAEEAAAAAAQATAATTAAATAASAAASASGSQETRRPVL